MKNQSKLVLCLHGKLVQVWLIESSFSKSNYSFFLASEEFISKDISHESVNMSNDDLSAKGISIKQTLRDMYLEYCLMGKKEVCTIRN
jgi:hypothetical protein